MSTLLNDQLVFFVVAGALAIIIALSLFSPLKNNITWMDFFWRYWPPTWRMGFAYVLIVALAVLVLMELNVV